MKKKSKSSRSRMQGRNRQYRKAAPGFVVLNAVEQLEVGSAVTPKEGVSKQEPNRAFYRLQLAHMRRMGV